MLRLMLLGRPRIILDGQPVTQFVSGKALALLCYLALRSGAHAREGLAGLFWGEMPETRARANLRMALYSLQQRLPGCLTVTRLEASFNRAQEYWSDVEQLAAAEMELAGLDRPPANELSEIFASALQLYRGELLEGLLVEGAEEFGEWLLVERERLRHMALTVSQLLAEYALRQGGYRLAAQALRRSVEIEPWQEHAHRQLMLALARSGDTTAALAQFAACRQALAEGLGVEPMAETTALAERIRFARQKTRRHNLPSQPTPFVGRTAEIAGLRRMIGQSEGRLITLTGPGGIGKTRLAIQVAAGLAEVFFEGVYFVALSELAGADHFAAAVLDALDIPIQGETDPLEQLGGALHTQELLLVLDSFEHVLEAAGMLSTLLQAAPGVHFMVTSRERLSLQWELVFPLDGLEVPLASGADDLEAYSASRFLLQCIRRVKPAYLLSHADRTAVQHICQITEGVPLALELASSWATTLSLPAIAGAVERDLDALTTSLRDVTPQHRSLRAAIGTSWELLPSSAQHIFRALSIFRGGFSPAAALQVCGASADALDGLAVRSLLRQEQSGRFGFHEMLRQFAQDQLQSDAEAHQQIARLHCQYYADFLRANEERIVGSQMADTLHQIREEMENIRSAWIWAVMNGDWEAIPRFTPCLSRFLELSGLLREGESLFSQAVDQLRAHPNAQSPHNAHILARLLVEQTRFKRALAQNDEALQSLAEVAQVLENIPDAQIEASAHLQWAEVLERQGDYQGAEDHYAHSLHLAKSAENPALQAGSLVGLGIASGEKGDVAQASAHFSAALEISRAIGDRRGENVALHNLAIAAIYQDNRQAAQRYFEEELDLVHAFGGQRWEVMTLLGLAMLAGNRGDYAQFEGYHQRALQICLDIGERREAGTALDGLGLAALAQGRLNEAALTLEQALHRHAETGNRQGECNSRMYLALVQRAVGEYPRALAGLAETLATLRELKVPRDECALLAHLSVTQLLSGDLTAALSVARQALALAQQMNDPSCEASALAALGRVLEAMGDYQEAEASCRKAFELHQGAGQPHLALEDAAGLASLALALEKHKTAFEQAEFILNELASAPVQGLEPMRVYLAVYRALQAAGDRRAAQVLKTAYDLLMTQAENIQQPAQRTSFLEQVQVNRAVIAAWEQSAACSAD